MHEYRRDAGRRARRGDIDAGNPGVGVRAANERNVQHPGHGHVADVPATPRQEPAVLDAGQACADHFGGTLRP